MLQPAFTLLASIALAATPSTQTAPRLPSLEALVARGFAPGRPNSSGTQDGICMPDWESTFGPAAGTDGIVIRGLVFDDGSGPALVVVGNFTAAGGRAAHHVARWDGTQWSPMGQGLGAAGFALAVHDDGSGPALYAGGALLTATHEPSLARWNGVDWDPIPFPGVGAIHALASYDDSTGPALYAGGDFTITGGQATRIARFDGTWSVMQGASIPSIVNDLAVHTEGGVTSLYLAFFGTAQVNGQPSIGALRWSSAGWSRILGQSVGGGRRLAVHDDGGGAALYIGGTPSGPTPRALARLVNGAWVEVGLSVPGVLRDLASIDLGAGPRLHAAIQPSAGITGAPVVLEVTGGAPLTVVTDQVDGALAVNGLVGFDHASGTQLVLLGRFASAGAAALYNVARVDGDQWRALGGNPDVQRPVEVATAFGSGPARRWIAVRQRANSTGVVRPFVDAWDGIAWTSLGEVTGTTTPSVSMLEVLDDGSGERLYAGGSFTAIDGVSANGIAVHDGAGWSALGAGLGGGTALCAALIDVGQGPIVVVGGTFTSAGGAPLNRIASWDGNAWSPLAGGDLQGTAHALAVDESGATPVLYVGGQFGSAGGVTCSSIARWDGASWSNLGPGLMTFFFNGDVDDLALFDEGQGLRLFVTGVFEVPGSSTIAGIARWDGTSWSDVGGASAGGLASSRQMLVHDDGTGPALYMAGNAYVLGSPTLARGVARWDGTVWEGLPGEPFEGVVSLSVFDAGDGRALMCAGSFHGSPAGDAFVARWRGCPAVVGEVYCAPAVPNSTGVGATLSALGSTLIVEDDLLLSAADLPQNSFGVFLASQTRDFLPGYNGSQGALCLGGAVGLFTRPGEVQNTGAVGALELALDLTSLPTPAGAVPAAPGETWHFQAWYRDRALLGATSNFTPGVSVGFE